MGAGDFALNAHVRQVFARHWLETQGMNLITANGILTICGRIAFRTVKQGKGVEMSPDFLGMLENELRAIRGVKRIRWQLDNWTKREDGWTPADAREQPKSGMKPTLPTPSSPPQQPQSPR